jgi:hypothetical protein
MRRAFAATASPGAHPHHVAIVMDAMDKGATGGVSSERGESGGIPSSGKIKDFIIDKAIWHQFLSLHRMSRYEL